MSILIGIGAVGVVTTAYLTRKGWHALHRAVGIRPGVLRYEHAQDAAPPPITCGWRQLSLETTQLSVLPTELLAQLQRIDDKYHRYYAYLKDLGATSSPVSGPHASAIPTTATQGAPTESAFVLHKLLHTRLPDALASYYHLHRVSTANPNTPSSAEEQAVAADLLRHVLDRIEARLDAVLTHSTKQHLQELQVMKHYVDSQH